jgi:hypothetical protein
MAQTPGASVPSPGIFGITNIPGNKCYSFSQGAIGIYSKAVSNYDRQYFEIANHHSDIAYSVLLFDQESNGSPRRS